MTRVTTLLSLSIVLAIFASCHPFGVEPSADTPQPDAGDAAPAAPTYEAAIEEGRASAQAVVDHAGASALTIAFVDANKIIWSEQFGLANRDENEAPTAKTLFGIGSVSKTFAATAVMKLVDRGVIRLDEPIVTYLPSFKMASAGYEKVTPRMLLNHSSGFPGTEYRNGITRSTPVPDYRAQVFDTLSKGRLKAPPGFMSVYCNDGFTVVEALIEATTGKTYAQFVQDEILTPLGMPNTHFTLEPFDAGTYARSYGGDGKPKPQERLNLLGSGGLYSTSEDMGRFAMMFLGNGAVGDTRIISADAVAEMAVDSTAKSFNPVHSNAFAYGLGWDTVVQPGLRSVGFDGWAKGGDTGDYHAALVVSPQAKLGVIVLIAGASSGAATSVAERVLITALAERGSIGSVPSELTPVAKAVPAPAGLLDSIAGEYAQGALVLQLEPQADGTVQAFVLTAGERIKSGEPLKYRDDGWFASDAAPLTSFKVVEANLWGQPMQYLVKRSAGGGFSNFLDQEVMAQRVKKKEGDLSSVWQNRLSSTWLVVNAHPDEISWNELDPRLLLSPVDNLNGLVGVRALVDTAPGAPFDPRVRLVDPSGSDTHAVPWIVVPGINGRDLEELDFETRAGEEWARLGSYLHRPLASVPALANGTTTVTIGSDGNAEWRSVTRAAPAMITITGTSAWQVFDADFKNVAHGKGNGGAALPSGNGLGYLTLFGAPGQTVTVVVQ